MTLAKSMAWANKTLIVQASLTIITYDRQAIFKVKATVGFTMLGARMFSKVSFK